MQNTCSLSKPRSLCTTELKDAGTFLRFLNCFCLAHSIAVYLNLQKVILPVKCYTNDLWNTENTSVLSTWQCFYRVCISLWTQHLPGLGWGTMALPQGPHTKHLPKLPSRQRHLFLVAIPSVVPLSGSVQARSVGLRSNIILVYFCWTFIHLAGKRAIRKGVPTKGHTG